MKKYLLGLSLAAASWQAHAATLDISAALNLVSRIDILDSSKNVINWKLGDYQDHNVSIMGMSGTAHKQATTEEGNGVWMKTDISLMGQAQTQEVLLDRATGKVLKERVNGQEQDPAAGGQVTIIEQSETSVTVPAGKFDCMYIKAKITQNGQDTQVEMWANPVNVNLDGQLKIIAQTQYGPLTMELTKFGAGHAL